MSFYFNSRDFEIKNFVDSFKSYQASFMSMNYSKEILLDKYNYVLTRKAKDRLDKLFTYIINGIPILLEGETGTSKTITSEIICEYISEMRNKSKPNQKKNESYIKLNLSSEIKINDLMQKLVGDKNSISGIEVVDGPFLRAFKTGIPLILDDINLASEEVLQSIEAALDSGEINIDIPGIGKINCEKKGGFCLIAIQNPNKGYYRNKRQYLTKRFLSHFQIIEFPPFEIQELEEISKILFISFNNNKGINRYDGRFIHDLINFHRVWTTEEERKNEITCFTIREIIEAIKAYIAYIDFDDDEIMPYIPFKIIKIIYASRYPSHIKNKLLELLGKFKTFEEGYKSYLRYGSHYHFEEDLKGLYKNEILDDVFESSLFSLEKGRNIIIVGERGVGKSNIAREIARLFNLKNEKNENDFYHFI